MKIYILLFFLLTSCTPANRSLNEKGPRTPEAILAKQHAFINQMTKQQRIIEHNNDLKKNKEKDKEGLFPVAPTENNGPAAFWSTGYKGPTANPSYYPSY